MNFTARSDGFFEFAGRVVRCALGPAGVVEAAELKGYLDGIAAAQAMTGFSDETFRSILDKEGLTGIDLDGTKL